MIASLTLRKRKLDKLIDSKRFPNSQKENQNENEPKDVEKIDHPNLSHDDPDSEIYGGIQFIEEMTKNLNDQLILCVMEMDFTNGYFDLLSSENVSLDCKVIIK